MKEYYCLYMYDRESFLGLFEVDYELKIVDSVFYRILKKYRSQYIDGNPLINQIISAYNANESEDPEFNSSNYSIKQYYLGPGNYYPRIYRPLLNTGISIDRKCKNCLVKDNEREQYFHNNYLKVIDYKNEYISIKERFFQICKYIYPSKANYNVYSSEIRTLLLIINTEIEAQMKSILQENGLIKKAYRTKDFIKLNSILKLNQYCIKLRFFDELPESKPYYEWNEETPTTSLPWYNAYNEIKHDKYDKIISANFYNLYNSFSALATLLYAEFANFIDIKNEIESTWKIINEPKWEENEKYCFDEDWKMNMYFENART